MKFTQNRYDPGIGTRFAKRTKRIINKDGSFNVNKVGARFRPSDAYLVFIKMSWFKFLLSLFMGFVFVNVLFALLYLSLGDGSLTVQPSLELIDRFAEAFFFSTQTFTTVGYGALAPVSKAASFIASLEAFVGFLSFSLATGLLFGRFSRPNAKILFSKNALINDVEGQRSLVFRIVNERPTNLMEMSANVILNMTTHNQDGTNRTFQTLDLNIARLEFFPLNWTIVHPIDERSPMHEMSNEEIINADGELLIHIKGFDEMFSQVVHKRFSYHLNEVVPDAKFERIFETTDDGEIILEINKIDLYQKAGNNEPVN